jgi:alkaline phosphatase D
MHLFRTSLKFIFLFVTLGLHASSAKLLTGPMIGSTTSHSTKIWIAYHGKSDNIVALYDSFRREVKYPSHLNYLKDKHSRIVMTMDFTNLKSDTKYTILIKLGDAVVKEKYEVKTLSDEAIEDFSFIIGSCFLAMPNGLGKSFLPGRHRRILQPMIDAHADFNLWLGDNCYYLFGAWKSYERMFNRQLSMRTQNKLYAKYLSVRPNYAIWDDHDFGPNDCDGGFPLKDTALLVFTHFWANENWGLPNVKGTFSSFSQYDATFFLTDDRYYRSTRQDSAHGSILGDSQLIWLEQSLLSSKATFKFIVTGSEVLNRQTEKECWINNFPETTNALLEFIKQHKITGVIFLTGDRHLTHLIKDEQNGYYPLYDFTCSPVLSFVSEEHEIEMNNPQVVKGTLVQDQRNYGQVSITGQPGNRVCTLYDYDEYGVLKWKFEINEKELK